MKLVEEALEDKNDDPVSIFIKAGSRVLKKGGCVPCI